MAAAAQDQRPLKYRRMDQQVSARLHHQLDTAALAPAASIDHILPRSRGGTDDDSNLQIAHLRCNLLKHDQAQPPPEYARARLSLTLDGTPVPYGSGARFPSPGAAPPPGELVECLRPG